MAPGFSPPDPPQTPREGAPSTPAGPRPGGPASRLTRPTRQPAPTPRAHRAPAQLGPTANPAQELASSVPSSSPGRERNTLPRSLTRPASSVEFVYRTARRRSTRRRQAAGHGLARLPLSAVQRGPRADGQPSVNARRHSEYAARDPPRLARDPHPRRMLTRAATGVLGVDPIPDNFSDNIGADNISGGRGGRGGRSRRAAGAPARRRTWL